MNRKYYTFKQLAELLPELNAYLMETVSAKSLPGVLLLIDQWAAENNLVLFQMVTPVNDEQFFIFNTK